MKQDWTKEEWKAYEMVMGGYKIKGIGGKIICLTRSYGKMSSKEHKANANRIVACVNACAGLSDEDLKLVKKAVEFYKNELIENENENKR